MRNPWARRVSVSLILAFPLLLSLVATPSPVSFVRGVEGVLPIVAVETVLVGGLLVARRERRRLLVELEAARNLPRHISRPAGALVKAKAAAWRSVSSSPGV
ncbi:hypothetical protein SAMN05444166_3497 [Singulisphaera sp. GP187]|uniref:hypothetical protein n=1 Tax=Singulisphaera sp. GP187 TaxID=1882752 RepID=UPI000927EF2C|nr:hypothetical protein [Singulisphaera sp. GP187]SIO28554.1 hypothetical protein SAMN05444166_3497 [Singulisphaera sp. GP187]